MMRRVLEEHREGCLAQLQRSERQLGKPAQRRWKLSQIIFCSRVYHVSLMLKYTLFYIATSLKLGFCLTVHGAIEAMDQASYYDISCHHLHRNKFAPFDINSFELFSLFNVEFNCCLKCLQEITYDLVLKQKVIVCAENHGNRVKNHTLALSKQLSVIRRMSPVLYFLRVASIFLDSRRYPQANEAVTFCC